MAICEIHGESVFLDEAFKEGMIATRCTECSRVVEIRNVLPAPEKVIRHINGYGRYLGVRPKPMISA